MAKKRAKKLATEGAGERLTEDLLNEVLLRLPIKPLLRFKSVSKSWFSLISSHSFAKSHLQRALTCADGYDQTLIVHVDRNEYPNFDDGEDGSFLLLNIGSLEFGENLKFPYSQGVYPFVSKYPFEPPSFLVGSDCGIVCVCVDVTDWRAAKNKSDIYLWNPATKQSKLIPPPTIQHSVKREALGFCFDHINLDFKVVRVVKKSNVSAEVYSSNKNVWQKIEPKPNDFPRGQNFDACLHGFLFTAGSNGVMAFDLNKEMFICDIDLPAGFSDDKRSCYDVHITDFKDSIALFNSVNCGFDGRINLWTLDDEACLHGSGVKASWSLTLSIYLGNGLQLVEGFFNSVEFLVEINESWRVLYNSDKKVSRELPFQRFYFVEVSKYTESLFSVAGSKLINWTASSSRLQDDSDS